MGATTIADSRQARTDRPSMNLQTDMRYPVDPPGFWRRGCSGSADAQLRRFEPMARDHDEASA